MRFVLTSARSHSFSAAIESRINYNLFSLANYLICSIIFLFFARAAVFCCSSTLFPTNSFLITIAGMTLVRTVTLASLSPAHDKLGIASV